jgi:hypothetical protein
MVRVRHAPDQGFRVVYLAGPEDLTAIYDDMASFTRDFLSK